MHSIPRDSSTTKESFNMGIIKVGVAVAVVAVAAAAKCMGKAKGSTRAIMRAGFSCRGTLSNIFRS